MRWTGCVEYMGDMRNAYTILVTRPEGNKAIGKQGKHWTGFN
jgi:hypothetical protein